MTIAPLGVTPAPNAPGATSDAPVPTDFLSAIQAALTKMGVKPQGPSLAEEGAPAPVAPVPPPLDKLEAPAAKPTKRAATPHLDVEPVTTPDSPSIPAQPTPAPATVPPQLAALVAQYTLAPAPRPVAPAPGAQAQPQAPLVEEGAQARPPLVEEGALARPPLVEEGALARPPLVEEGALAPVSKPGDLSAPQGPHLDKLDAPGTKLDVEPVETPAPAAQTPSLDVEPVETPAPAAQTQPRHLALEPRIQPTSPLLPPPISVQTPTTTPVQAPAATPPVANTTPLDRVAAQVFPEVTGLVSRGSGTHRISLTLNPEHLGEVRVVMTMRAGAVHVRLAAGQEARVSLADGSRELSRLLEHAGATEARVVVRELPASVTSTTPSTPTTDTTSTGTNSGTNSGTNTGLGGERSPDQHAGTRADHQARDGSDHTPRSIRTDGPTAGISRSIKPVTGTRTAAGVDLTM